MQTAVREIHVAPGAPAGGTGGRSDPLASLDAARELIRSSGPGARSTVILAPGRHPLTTPLLLSPEDSGTTFRGDGDAVVDGGEVIAGWRERTVNGVTVWAAPAPGPRLRSLFADGVRRPRPRFPLEGELWIEEQPGLDLGAGMVPSLFRGSDRFRYGAGDLIALSQVDQVEAVVLHYWVDEHMPLLSIDPDERIVVSSRRSIFALRDDVAERFARYHLENVLEMLGGRPGEWYLDPVAGEVLYVPEPGREPGEVEICCPAVDRLVVLRGDPAGDRWVEDVHFEGIRFVHADRPEPAPGPATVPESGQDAEYASSPQAAAGVDAAIELQGARGCSLSGCAVEHVGGYGIELGPGCTENAVNDVRLLDLGAGGVKISGAETAGDPDRTGDNSVTDCEIAGGGRIFPAGVGVLIRHAAGNTVARNHIHDLYYSGVSCGWTWGYGPNPAHDNRIEGNHIHQIGQGVLSDMGGIYVLGVQPGTVLRGNHIHDIRCRNYGGWCIYLDEGSSHVLVEDNVCHDSSSECFHQHYGRENIVRNNVFAFGGLGQVSVSRTEEHCSFTIERNVIIGAGTAAFTGRTDREQVDRSHIHSDLNLIWDTTGEPRLAEDFEPDGAGGWRSARRLANEEWLALGRDRHSLLSDPGMEDLEARRFGLSPGSPALEVGYRPPAPG